MRHRHPYVWLKALWVLCFIPCAAQGQFVFERVNNVPVTTASGNLQNPWFGGLNNPQFSPFDLNNDGLDDLVVLERGVFEADSGSGSRLLTFINAGTPNEVAYTYAPEYEKYFPRLRQWMLMADYNCDGINDIFTCNPGQVDLYLGHHDGANKPFFTYKGFLPFQSFAGALNIFVSAVDIPAIKDVNGDGDLDIITFQQFGITIDYFENLSEELTGTCGDTMIYQYRDFCWGKVWETGLQKPVILDTCDNTPKDGGGPRHTGSTLLAFDEDGDGDQELVLGDVSFDNLNRLLNGGAPDTAHIIAQDIAYPSYDRPVNMHIFPASFYMDVNNDGRSDLIVAPNSPRNSLNHNCAWYYEDISTNDTVKFQFRTDTFLVSTTLDFGEGAHPAFFDYNGDGLLDIIAGNYGYYAGIATYTPGLALLKNTGTATNPAFELVTRDYENLTAIRVNNKPLLNLTPTFADMDGDGDKDMLVGDTSGRLSYFRNDPATGVANFTMVTNSYFDIDAGAYSAPFVYDVNGDGVLDLLLGRKQGNVQYYENRGTTTAPDFDVLPTNSDFGQVDARYQQFITGYSTPIITRLDGTSQLYLLSGNDEGKLIGYFFDASKIYGGPFRKVFNYYSGIDEGEQSSLAVADLDSNGKLEMVTGSYRGGLIFYRQNDSLASLLPVGMAEMSLLTELDVVVYPNPVNDKLNISLTTPLSESLQVILYDLLGKELINKEIDSNKQTIFAIDIGALQRGIYLCSIRAGQQAKVVKVVKL
jgi:hypothetical protein